MQVYLNEITGTADCIVSMLFSKRTWTREKELHIRDLVDKLFSSKGFYIEASHTKCDELKDIDEMYEDLSKHMKTTMKWGCKHITLLRFMDFSFTVEGMHRAGQDDWDAHAQRFNNRIIRSSTRLATFDGDEMSEFYEGKILTMDQVLEKLGCTIPDKINKNNVTFVRATNGYIREDLVDDKDVKRGLYMECIPSNFIFKVNLTEWAHVYKMRNNLSHANPEVKKLCEDICDILGKANPWLTRQLFQEIEN